MNSNNLYSLSEDEIPDREEILSVLTEILDQTFPPDKLIPQETVTKGLIDLQLPIDAQTEVRFRDFTSSHFAACSVLQTIARTNPKSDDEKQKFLEASYRQIILWRLVYGFEQSKQCIEQMYRQDPFCKIVSQQELINHPFMKPFTTSVRNGLVVCMNSQGEPSRIIVREFQGDGSSRHEREIGFIPLICALDITLHTFRTELKASSDVTEIVKLIA